MPLTTDQIKANIKALRDAGRPESVVDSYINQAGFSQEYQENLDSLQRYNESPIGKFLNKSEKFVGLLPRLLGFSGTTQPEQLLKKRYVDDIKGKNLFVESLKDIVKEGGKTGIEAAQLLTSEIGAPIKGLKGALAAKELVKFGSKQAAIQGGLGAQRRAMEGEEIESALKGGAIEGALNIGSIVGLPIFKKLIKESGKSLIKASSSVRNFAIDHAINKPEILINPQPSVVSVGEAIVDTLGDFSDEVKRGYNELIDKINVPEGLPVDASKIRGLIESLDLDENVISSKLKSQRTANALKLDDNAIDRFVAGGNLNFQESKKINSLLFDIVDAGVLPELGSGAIGKISNIKRQFLGILDDQIPGIKEANKYYAENTKFYQDTLKDISKKSGDVRENVLNIIGQKQAGLGTAGRTRSQEVSRLRKLDDIMNTNHLSQLKDSLVSEEFERIGMGNLMETLRFGSSAGLGAYIGSQAGGLPGSVVGAAIGSGASGMLRSPETTRKLILGSELVKQGLQRAPSQLTETLSGVARPLRPAIIRKKGDSENDR